MKKVVEYIIAYTFRLALWFRYRIKVVGLDKLNSKTLPRSGGVIFMPNHPAYFIDPIVVTLAVFPKFSIRPMIVEYMFYTPFINGLMRFMDALPVPNFASSSNSLKRKKSEQVVQTVIDSVKHGQNFLIMPAGRVKHTAYEAVGGASAIQRILTEAPEANVVLVRTKGLWGSSFSRALLNSSPSLGASMWEAVKIILKNLIFFTPRRQIIVELEPAPADFPRDASRLELNKFLEHYYNKPDGLTKQTGEYPGDSLVLVSYSMWGEKYLPVKKIEQDSGKEIYISDIPKDVREKVIKKLAELKECDPLTIKPEMTLASDLGLDSLDTADLVAFLNDQFDISGVPVNELTTVAKVMAVASRQVIIKEEIEDEKFDLTAWLKPIVPKKRAMVAPGDTIAEVFLNQCELSGNAIACADGRLGIQKYSTLKLRAIILARYLRKQPGKYIGIMLPASIAANLLILACELAGKIPLMVNWTVGTRHLESVVALSSVQVVISSWAFLDRLENANLNGIEDRLVMLEDVARQLSIFDKLKGLILSKFGTKTVLRTFCNKSSKDSEAVLLFTSGTESMPKGVPLTHNNILSSMRGALTAQEIFNDDIIFGILPPFHSFGFTISGILGLISGIRVFYSPDPTDGKRLATAFGRWRITLMVGAPTFVKGILKAANPQQMQSMRLCVTGAEKAPPELFQMLEQFNKPNCLLEGYGITECSPILTMNPVGGCPKGVGKAMPGVELMIVHPETEEPLPIGDRGLILAKGPNVFNGYINPGITSPFTTINGERWYRTGDLGFLDKQGNLTISGRLKRFIKVGGEMVSLSSIEEALLQMASKNKWPTMQEGPTLAVCAKEAPGEKTKIFLFSRFELTVDDVNNALRESGFSNLIKVSTVMMIPEIPIMGTGKINYRLLEGQYLANA